MDTVTSKDWLTISVSIPPRSHKSCWSTPPKMLPSSNTLEISPPNQSPISSIISTLDLSPDSLSLKKSQPPTQDQSRSWSENHSSLRFLITLRTSLLSSMPHGVDTVNHSPQNGRRPPNNSRISQTLSSPSLTQPPTKLKEFPSRDSQPSSSIQEMINLHQSIMMETEQLMPSLTGLKPELPNHQLLQREMMIYDQMK